jgi:hypothetical protein
LSGHRDQEFTDYVTATMGSWRRLAYLLCQDPSRVDDIVQAAMTRLYTHWGKARAAGRIDAYARTILVRVYLRDRQSGWATRVDLTGEPPEPAAAHGNYDDELDMRAALAALPPRQRATRPSGLIQIPADATIGSWEAGMVGATVTWGLLAAWVVHDAEEWATMPAWSERSVDRLNQRYPRMPRWFWPLYRTTRLEATIAIGLVGALIAVASWDGARTTGRSGFFQIVLIAFGLHAIVHAGHSALARAYTPGLITAVLVVAPYSWWAWHRIEQAGIAAPGSASSWIIALALFPPVVLGTANRSRNRPPGKPAALAPEPLQDRPIVRRALAAPPGRELRRRAFTAATCCVIGTGCPRQGAELLGTAS